MADSARILVVDDSPTIRRVVERALREAGHQVTTASGGEEALRQVALELPDLVLLDFVMPGMNGYQVAKSLAEERQQAAPPVLLMCTRTDQVPEGALQGVGVAGVVEKPFSPDDIVARAEAALAEHPPPSPRRASAAPPSPPNADASSPPLPFDASDLPTEPDLAVMMRAPSDGPSLDGDLAAAAALADLTRLLADALWARGIDDADLLSEAICNQVRAGLTGALMRELVRRELGTDALRQPLPALFGDLNTVPLPEVLQLMKLQGQTGLLEVSLDRARYEVAFRKGQVVAIRARNVEAGLRLGRYFVDQGALPEEELEAFVQQTATGKKPIGQRLLEEGRINGEQLEAALEAQAHDLMFGLLRAKEGVFGLRPGEDKLWDAAGSPGFSVDELLFESLRRVDEASVFQKEVPSLESRFCRVPGAGEEGLTAEEIQVFRELTDKRPQAARTLMKLTHVASHQIEMVLYRLVVLGRAIRVDDGAPASDAKQDGT